jgi:hypothetical protein
MTTYAETLVTIEAQSKAAVAASGFDTQHVVMLRRIVSACFADASQDT